MTSHPLLRGACSAAVLLLLGGCASLQQQSHNAAVDRELVGGNYLAAAQIAERRMGLPAPAAGETGHPPVTATSHLLDHLEAAEAWRMAGDPERAIAHYDAVETALQQVELQGMVAAGGQQLGAVLLNDSVLSYTPSPAEAVLVNYYKALSFLSRGDADNARVELNRADDRTRRAVERYAREIAQAQAEAAKEPDNPSPSNVGVQRVLDQQFPEMSRWAPYAEFIVPPATYLQALLLARSRDRADQEKARGLFERVLGVSDGHPVVAEDARESRKGRSCPKDDCIWVLAEHGQGPTLEERRATLPIASTSGVITVTLALPALVSRTPNDSPPFRLLAGETPLSLQPLASMDRVVQTEFQKRLPAIVTRAIASATTKAVAQEAVNRNAGALAGLVMNLAAMASTSADLRMWRSMPGRFSLLRIPRASAAGLALETAQGRIPLPVPDAGAHLIHIKMPGAQAAPRIEVLPI